MTKTRRTIGIGICIAAIPIVGVLYLIATMKCALEMLSEAEETWPLDESGETQ